MTAGRRPRTLEHPLPAGLRDLLPKETSRLREITRTVLERFELFGYRLVTPPAFELAEVIEPRLGASSGDVVRFIEPESGNVAVIRPDMTPQIARMLATRLSDKPGPYRLAYEGTVVRRRVGRAKKHRQIPQLGVELCGVAGLEADLELLELAADAVRATGLTNVTIDLSDAGIVRSLLVGMIPEAVDRVTYALAKKDEAALHDVSNGCPYASELRALTRLHGDRDALKEASALLGNTPARASAARLLELYDRAVDVGLDGMLSADPADVREAAYYTGPTFCLYARGPGEPIGSGGRYDELFSAFGLELPAAGFGLDLDALQWACKEARASIDEAALDRKGVVVVGSVNDPRIVALRRRNVASIAIGTLEEALAYARAWDFARVWTDRGVIDPAEISEETTRGPALDLALEKGSPTGSIEEAAEELWRVLSSRPRGV